MGNNVKLTWHTEKRRLGDLIEWDKNPRQLKEHDAEHLKKSLDNFGVADALIINTCLSYTSPSPRDPCAYRMPSSA